MYGTLASENCCAYKYNVLTYLLVPLVLLVLLVPLVLLKSP